MTDTLDSVLQDLAGFIEHELDEGRQTVPVDPIAAPVLAPSAPAKPPVVESPPPAPEKTTPSTTAVASTADRAAGLAEIAKKISECMECELCNTRSKTVPGQGNQQPEVMFVGEGPGHEEDQQGLAFVGPAGKLLTRMIEAMGYTRDDVFIANVVKCRPPGNRTPYPHEMQACLPYLAAQIRILQPKVIVSLGATALKGLVEVRAGITKLRGKWLSFEGIDLMPTYPPAYLLRSPEYKKDTWEDLKTVLKHLGREIPPVKKGG